MKKLKDGNRKKVLYLKALFVGRYIIHFNKIHSAHKKTWGAWILARRTLTYQIDARCDWMKYGQRYEKYVHISNTKVASKIEGDVFILDGSNYKYDFAFGAYKAWVTHPGVDYALVECNYSNF
jgi:hypothetical protein